MRVKLSEYDVLDLLPHKPRCRWQMTYRNGEVSESAFRFNLITDNYLTRLTARAAEEWPAKHRPAGIEEL